MTWLLVFVAMFALDFVWALYTAGVAEKRPHFAAVNSSLIILLGGYATTRYVNDNELLIPAALGAYVGTLAAVGVETSALLAKCQRFVTLWRKGSE